MPNIFFDGLPLLLLLWICVDLTDLPIDKPYLSVSSCINLLVAAQSECTTCDAIHQAISWDLRKNLPCSLGLALFKSKCLAYIYAYVYIYIYIYVSSPWVPNFPSRSYERYVLWRPWQRYIRTSKASHIWLPSYSAHTRTGLHSPVFFLLCRNYAVRSQILVFFSYLQMSIFWARKAF